MADPPVSEAAAMPVFAADDKALDATRAVAEHYDRRQRATRLYSWGVAPAMIAAIVLYAWLGGLSAVRWAELIFWILVPAPLAGGLALEFSLRRALHKKLGRRVPNHVLLDAEAKAALVRTQAKEDRQEAAARAYGQVLLEGLRAHDQQA